MDFIRSEGNLETKCLYIYKHLVSRFPSDLMKSTVVDESLSSYKPMYCSREYQASTRLIQQYEKSTLNVYKVFNDFCLQRLVHNKQCGKIYNSTGITVIKSYIILVCYDKKPQVLNFSVTDIEGSVLSSCKGFLALGLVTPRDHLQRLPPIAQLLCSPSNCQDVYYMQEESTSRHVKILVHNLRIPVKSQCVQPSGLSVYSATKCVQFTNYQVHKDIINVYPNC